MDHEMNTENEHAGPLDLKTMLAYLEGRLDAEATAEVEARIAGSPEDAAALEALDQSLDKMSSVELLDLEAAFLGGLEEAEEGPSPEEIAFEAQLRRQKRGWLLWGTGLAAGIALLMFFAITLLNKEVAPADLFQQHFTPYEDIYTARNPIDRAAEMDAALAAYNQGDYQDALEGFQKVMALRPYEPGQAGHTYARLYAGISQLALGEGEQAVEMLAPLANGDSDLQAIAAWYTALGELESGSVERARPWLESLAKGGGKMAADAEELLGELPD